MPFLPIDTGHPNVFLGMWKTDEDEKFFLDQLNIYENEQAILDKIKHPVKRLEWLASRLCLKKILHISHKVESLNEQTGKPFLSDHSHNISYSHSHLMAGAIASRETEVAIDIENMKKPRKLEARYLFMGSEELDVYDELNDSRLFFLIWSAKETLYKVHGQRGISFRENLLVRLNDEKLKPNGVVTGIIQQNGFRKEYEIRYKFFDDIVLTFTFDADPIELQQPGIGEGRKSELLSTH